MNETDNIFDTLSQEFSSIFRERKSVYPETEAIIVLSGKQFTTKDNQIIKADTDENAENVARITYAVNAIKTIVSQKCQKPLAKLTLGDLEKHAPLLLLSGTTEQLSTMKKIALMQGISSSKIVEIDCGKADTANTKTQFETINTYASDHGLKHLTLVSSDYHVPRVGRTANKILDEDIQYDVIYTRGIPYDVSQTVLGEIERIETYAQKEDISPNVRQSKSEI